MTWLLDTTILIYLMKHKTLALVERIAAVGENDTVAMSFVTYANRLKRAGTPIGGNDLWIACQALSVNATLVTNNTREFSRIDGLRLENWIE